MSARKDGARDAKFSGVRKNYRDYNWVNEGVYTDDIPYPLAYPKFLTITKEEFDTVLKYYLDKANKTGPTVNGNIALLDAEGDILDSGVQPSDIDPNLLDGGYFSDEGEFS